MTRRQVLPIASVPCGEYKRPIELPHLETFPGAACYQPIDLPRCKAAPLQAFGSAQHAACLQPFSGRESECNAEVDNRADFS